MHDKRNATPASALAAFREYQILRAERVSRASLSAPLRPKGKDMATTAKGQA